MDLAGAVFAVKQELKNPEKLQIEQQVINKFGKLFAFENIDNITTEQFQEFFDFKNNHHWTIWRHKTNLTQDMKKLKKSLKILLDESIPINKRLKRLRDLPSPDFQKYLGKANFSPILLVTHPDKYPVYNEIVQEAFKKLEIPLVDPSLPIWERYPIVQQKICDLALKYKLSLWQIDWVWWKIIGEKSYDDLIKFINEEMQMQENYQPVVIKTLVDVGGQASLEEIEEQLHLHNPESDSKHITDTVMRVLLKHKIIRKVDDNGYALNLIQPLSDGQSTEISNLCQSKIDQFQGKQRIVLFSVSGKGSYDHFVDTMIQDVDTSSFENSEMKQFSKVRTWGAIDNKWAKSKWSKLRKGDILLFYRDKKYVASAILEGIEQNKQVATQMWGTKDSDPNQTWELIMYMRPENVSKQDVNSSDLHRLLGYKPEFMPTRTLDFTLVRNQVIENLIEKHVNCEKALSTIGFKLESTSINYWKISPGAFGEDWENQLQSGEIGIHFLDFGDLSTFTEAEMQQHIKDSYGQSEVAKRANTFGQMRDFMKIKEGDIIVANKGKKMILGIGRVIGPYKHKPGKGFPHTFPVDWYDTTEQGIPTESGWMVTVVPLSKEKFEDLLQLKSKYFLLRHNPEEGTTWGDKLGERYHFSTAVQNYTKLAPGAKTVWFDTEAGKYSFWGYGDISKIKKESDEHQYAYYDKFSFFNPPSDESKSADSVTPIKGDKLIQQKIQNVPNFNNRFSILPIPKDIYDIIISAKKLSEQEATQVDYLTPEDFENFLNAVPKLEAFNQPGQKPPMNAEQFQLLFRILYGSALKIFDALNIRVKDLDLDNRIIRISDSTSKFPYATILPTDVSYLKQYVSTLQKDDKLFDVHRATLWNYAKQIGNLAGLKIFRGKEERETEGMDLLIFRESRAMQMSLDGAGDGLIRRKLRVDFSNAVLRYDQPTIEDLKEWELNPRKLLQKLPKIKSNLETFENRSLPYPAASFSKIKKDIEKQIMIDDDVIEQIIHHLVTEKNLLLVGPVGSGKTKLASILPQIVWQKRGGYHSEIVTATSEWTTQDVIGGIIPKLDENNEVKYVIQKGCVTDTVSKNWLNGDSRTKTRVKSDGILNNQPHEFLGEWLVIDEFNRANIDKAFGQLFTALEYKKLQVPTMNENLSYEELLIPEDYRIIGTLNTYDKHFLFTLSDALKRRFAIVEINVPKYVDKDKEMFYVVRDALKKVLDHNTNLKIDEKNFRVVTNDKETIEALNQMFEIMSFIRKIKSLGTAILISMFSFMLSYHKSTGNWEDGLDMALTSSVVPQLETLRFEHLEVIREFVRREKLGIFFKKLTTQENKPQQYQNVFKKFVDYMREKSKFERRPRPSNDVVPNFVNGNLSDVNVEKLNQWDNLKKPKLVRFSKALAEIMAKKGIFEETELEEESSV